MATTSNGIEYTSTEGTSDGRFSDYAITFNGHTYTLNSRSNKPADDHAWFVEHEARALANEH